ncbi:MAG: tyrosine--tRNA ligase [bacterium]|nr:tyrosine--tRNA ligase [bacterium]MDZ4248239.1 tyrosine--tRNA ligase [Patescibacteria group bacterium]
MTKTVTKADSKPEAQKEALITQLVDRGTDTIYPSREALVQLLRGRRRLKVYLGLDPTSPDLHIGHLIVLQKMRHFQELGHEVILLFGDFTAQTGDPSDKQAARQPLTKTQVLRNARAYKRQVKKLLKFRGANPARTEFNSTWLEQMDFSGVAELAQHFTVQQLLERDMFERRMNQGKPISLREFLYPLMQGYDSVALNVDVEVGATDQTYNMLQGRKLLKEYKDKEKFVLTVPLLADSKGVKIGKTEGNAIAIAGKPQELYGQVMHLPDEVVVPAFEWCTSQSVEAVEDLKRTIKQNPRDAKMQLAKAIVLEVQGKDAAEKAERAFVRVFQKKETPKGIPTWRAEGLAVPLWKVLKESGMARSSSEAHRLIQQGAVQVNDVVQTDPNVSVVASAYPIIRVGKRRFLKVTR